MPYGTVNLLHGVNPGETPVTCTAGIGTFIVEFATLSSLTGDPVFEDVARVALMRLWESRSDIGLVGQLLDFLCEPRLLCPPFMRPRGLRNEASQGNLTAIVGVVQGTKRRLSLPLYIATEVATEGVSDAVIKHHDQKQLGWNGFISSCSLSSREVRAGA